MIAESSYFGYVVAHDITVPRTHLNETAHLVEAWEKREREEGAQVPICIFSVTSMGFISLSFCLLTVPQTGDHDFEAHILWGHGGFKSCEAVNSGEA